MVHSRSGKSADRDSRPTLSHSWSTTTIGLWLKYPNPYSPHVLSIDVLSRSINVDTGVLRTERLVGVKQAIPVSFIDLGGMGWVDQVVELNLYPPFVRNATGSLGEIRDGSCA
jgi:hypothetical protein